jgi:hypothetical protein
VGFADSDQSIDDDRLAGREPAQGGEITDLSGRQLETSGEIELLQGGLNPPCEKEKA